MSLVSIIMPYFKKEKHVFNSVKSVLNQSHENLEIIIIDDEINEKSSKILKEISNLDSRIKLIVNEKNLGAGESRNKAIESAKGEYIGFCDCDDLWKTKKLEVQLQFMKNLDLNYSFTAYEIIDENEKIIGSRKADNIIDFNKLRDSCDIGLSTVLIKKNIFDERKYRFPKLVTKEDYVLWLKFAKDKIQMMGIDQNLASWRRSKDSLSSSTIQKLLDGYKVYRIYLGYGRFKSMFYLINLSINFILKS